MDCVFCKIINGELSCKKLYEDDYVIAILDNHPSADGHTLIIPKKHYDDIMDIDDETILHINDTAKKITPILMERIEAEAISIRVNYGTTQAIKHYHMHLLPNYGIKKGYMTEEEAYQRLKDRIQ